MIDLISYFFNSNVGIIIISTATAALTAKKYEHTKVREYTGYRIIDEAIAVLKIATIVTISVLIVIVMILGLINLIFNLGSLPTPEFLKFAEYASKS